MLTNFLCYLKIENIWLIILCLSRWKDRRPDRWFNLISSGKIHPKIRCGGHHPKLPRLF